jgi:hypothetical protein
MRLRCGSSCSCMCGCRVRGAGCGVRGCGYPAVLLMGDIRAACAGVVFCVDTRVSVDVSTDVPPGGRGGLLCTCQVKIPGQAILLVAADEATRRQWVSVLQAIVGLCRSHAKQVKSFHSDDDDDDDDE